MLIKNKNNKILICTHSNTAADHFTILLLKTVNSLKTNDQINNLINENKILRLYSQRHDPFEKSIEILKVTYLG